MKTVVKSYHCRVSECDPVKFKWCKKADGTFQDAVEWCFCQTLKLTVMSETGWQVKAINAIPQQYICF